MTTDIVNRLAACENKPSTFLAPLALVTGTAVQVSTADLFATSVTFYGFKAVSATAAPTANGNDAQLGYTDYAGTLVAANSPAFLDVVPAGGAVTERATLGTKYNLKDFWVLGTTTDKIVVGYEA
jgi:hypothetical protein